MSETPISKPRKGHRRLFEVLFLLLIALIALIAMLPVILSTAPVQKSLLKRLSRQMGQQCTAEKIEMSWLSGMEIRDIQIVRPSISTVMVERITVERGLLPILRDRNIGLVSITQPRIFLAPRPPEPARKGGGGGGGGKKEPRPEVQQEALSFHWPAWNASLRIVNGEVSLPSGGAGQMEKITAVALDASLVSRPPQFEVKGTARNASTGGIVSLRVNIHAPRDSDLKIQDIRHEGTFECAGVQIRPLLAVIQGLPAGIENSEGLGGATLHFRGNGLNEMTLDGALDLDDLVLRGLFPAGDEPELDRLQISLKGAMAHAAPTNFSVNVTTPFLRLQANQDPRAAGTGDRFNLIASVDIPVLAALIPATLRLRQDVKIERGNLVLRGQLERGDNIQLRMLAQLPELKGQMGADTLALDEPASMDVDVRWGVDGLDVKQMTLRSGFASLEAAGRPGQLSANGKLDLAKALAQASTFLQLPSRDLGGTIDFNVATRWADDLTLAGVTVKMDARSFSWNMPKGPTLRNEDATMEIALNRGRDINWKDASLSLTAGSRNLSLAAGGGGFDLTAFPGTAPRITVTGRVDLATLAEWGVLPAGMQGRLTVVPMQVAMEKDVWSIPRLKALVGDLKVPAEPSPIEIHEVDVESGIQVDVAKKTATLQGLNLTADGLALQSPRFLIPFAPASDRTLEGSLTFDAGLASILELLRPLIPEKTVRSAEGHLRLKATAAEGFFSAAMNVGGLTLDSPKLAKPFQDQSVTARATVAVSTNGSWRADAFEINTSALGILGSAIYPEPTSNEFARIELSGDLTYDLQPLTELVPGFAEAGVTLAGKSTRPFRVVLPVGNTPVTEAMLQMDLTADRFALGNFVLEDVRIPARLSKGNLAMDATAKIGATQMNVRPRVALESPPVLTWQPKPPVMDGLPLDDLVAGQLLGRIHPIFIGASHVEGKAGLFIDAVQMPFDADWKNQATFSGRLTLDNVSLRADGWFTEILDLAKVRERDVRLDSQTLSFRCSRGRITTSPLNMSVGKLKMSFAGSVGFDQTLDYIVQVPLTEELVGRKIMEYLPGGKMEVPISGTPHKLRVDKDRFRSELNKLAKEAGKVALEDKADDLLQKFFEKRDKDKERRK